MSILDKIRGPEDVKNLPEDKLPELAKEIRQRIINVTSKNGGHIGPNLGSISLLIGQ